MNAMVPKGYGGARWCANPTRELSQWQNVHRGLYERRRGPRIDCIAETPQETHAAGEIAG
jgi:hypothetical protein